MVASTGPSAGSDDPTIAVSRELLGRGDEVVHLGPGATSLGIARAAVAEDAVRVVLVGADPDGLDELRAALAQVGADDVAVDPTA